MPQLANRSRKERSSRPALDLRAGNAILQNPVGPVKTKTVCTALSKIGYRETLQFVEILYDSLRQAEQVVILVSYGKTLVF